MSDGTGRNATHRPATAPVRPSPDTGPAPRALVRGTALLALAGLALLAAPVFSEGPLASAGWLAGETLCHQGSSRTLSIHGRPLAVCARCSGLFAGGTAGLMVLALGRARRWPLWHDRRWLVGALGLVVTHVVWGGVGLPDGGNAARLFTGLAGGLAFAPHAVEGLAGLAREVAARRASP